MDKSLDDVVYTGSATGLVCSCSIGPNREVVLVEAVRDYCPIGLLSRAQRAQFEIRVSDIDFGSAERSKHEAFKEFKSSGRRTSTYRVIGSGKTCALITIASSVKELPEEALAVWKRWGPR